MATAELLPIGITWFPAAVLSALLTLRSFLFDDLSEPDLLELKETCELIYELKILSPFEVF